MELIVSVDDNWGLGCQGQLLARVPDDLKRFKALTWGNVIILGHATLDTFPHGAPLPGRDNIILSRQAELSCAGARIAHSTDELFALLRRAYAGRDCFVVGGAKLYAQLAPYCRRALVTRFFASFTADCFLPALREPQWRLVEQSETLEHEGLRFAYLTYQNTAPLPY